LTKTSKKSKRKYRRQHRSFSNSKFKPDVSTMKKLSTKKLSLLKSTLLEKKFWIERKVSKTFSKTKKRRLRDSRKSTLNRRNF
jgi:hypothetical protein